MIFIHFPRVGDDKAVLAIQAAEAADLQGKFWEMHKLLFEKQAEWTGLAPANFPAWVDGQAAGLGLDVTRFRMDFRGEIAAKRAKQAVDSTAKLKQFLPLMFINSDTAYTGRVDFSGLDQVISLFALTKRQFTACPPMIIDQSKNYLATLHTAKGDIVMQLYADKAPLAVNNFVFLARSHWYDGITFLRVLPGILAQTGDPSETGLGNPGYLFASEIPAGLSFDHPGVVAMSNTGPNTNGSQFFITEAVNTQMNGQFTIFGQVLTGMDVVSSLAARDLIPFPVPPPGDELISVTITEH
jgi:cyclophilin family peptidyl-prolyl cis-trans isomerase